MKTTFEETNGTYTRQGNYLLPNVKLPEKEKCEIGVWGQRHKHYLKQHHKVRYYNLLTSGKLNEYLADIDEHAESLFFRLVKELSEKENVTEKLKAENQMLWVKRMKNVHNRAIEILSTKLILR